MSSESKRGGPPSGPSLPSDVLRLTSSCRSQIRRWGVFLQDPPFPMNVLRLILPVGLEIEEGGRPSDPPFPINIVRGRRRLGHVLCMGLLLIAFTFASYVMRHVAFMSCIRMSRMSRMSVCHVCHMSRVMSRSCHASGSRMGHNMPVAFMSCLRFAHGSKHAGRAPIPHGCRFHESSSHHHAAHGSKHAGRAPSRSRAHSTWLSFSYQIAVSPMGRNMPVSLPPDRVPIQHGCRSCQVLAPRMGRKLAGRATSRSRSHHTRLSLSCQIVVPRMGRNMPVARPSGPRVAQLKPRYCHMFRSHMLHHLPVVPKPHLNAHGSQNLAAPLPSLPSRSHPSHRRPPSPLLGPFCSSSPSFSLLKKN